MDQVANFEGNDRGQWDNGQYSTGPGVRARFPGERIGPAEGRRRLFEELAPVYRRLNGAFPGLPDGPMTALTSFSHNVGTGWMLRDRNLRDAVRSQDWTRVARAIQRYDKVRDRQGRLHVSSGLINRRRHEARILLRGLPNDPYGPHRW